RFVELADDIGLEVIAEMWSAAPAVSAPGALRSEEHTSELQSRFDLVCRLLLEKKNIERGNVTGCSLSRLNRCRTTKKPRANPAYGRTVTMRSATSLGAAAGQTEALATHVDSVC